MALLDDQTKRAAQRGLLGAGQSRSASGAANIPLPPATGAVNTAAGRLREVPVGVVQSVVDSPLVQDISQIRQQQIAHQSNIPTKIQGGPQQVVQPPVRNALLDRLTDTRAGQVLAGTYESPGTADMGDVGQEIAAIDATRGLDTQTAEILTTSPTDAVTAEQPSVDYSQPLVISGTGSDITLSRGGQPVSAAQALNPNFSGNEAARQRILNRGVWTGIGSQQPRAQAATQARTAQPQAVQQGAPAQRRVLTPYSFTARELPAVGDTAAQRRVLTPYSFTARELPAVGDTAAWNRLTQPRNQGGTVMPGGSVQYGPDHPLSRAMRSMKTASDARTAQFYEDMANRPSAVSARASQTNAQTAQQRLKFDVDTQQQAADLAERRFGLEQQAQEFGQESTTYQNLTNRMNAVTQQMGMTNAQAKQAIDNAPKITTDVSTNGQGHFRVDGRLLFSTQDAEMMSLGGAVYNDAYALKFAETRSDVVARQFADENVRKWLLTPAIAARTSPNFLSDPITQRLRTSLQGQ